ncbi:MAG: DegV family protein [Acidimicrobiales bacterium]
MTVAVITDSAASLPPDLAAERGVIVVPLHLMIGGRAVANGDMSLDDVLGRLADGVSTAAPSPGEFLTAVERCGCDEAVILTVASDVSATCNAARLAAEQASVPVSVMDTETAAGAQALVVLAAAEAADAGGARVAVEAAAREAIAKVRLVAVVDGLDQLVRSGRVPGIAGWAGNLLGLQPLFEFRHGKARRLRPATSREAALSRIIGHWRRSRQGAKPGEQLHVVALHAAAEDDAEAMLKRIRDEIDVAAATELVLEFSPVMVAHTGPGLVGLAWRFAQPTTLRQ